MAIEQNVVCCCPDEDHTSGCMVCGQELFCTPDKPLRATCFYCRQEKVTHVFCLAGHYVCDQCHSKDILDIVELKCNESELTDPLELLLDIFALPTLHMHGPNITALYRLFWSLLMVTASVKKIRLPSRKPSPGVKQYSAVSVNRYYAAAACIGIGIAYSIIHQVTPYSIEERGAANRMTALALTAISKFGGRCCKRDSTIAVTTARKHFGCFTGTGKSRYICSQYVDNDMCIESKCPYYPRNSGRG
ncbi:MAG: DUF5714 domain-containing protein [Candidatus Syntrophopropionicum ammoniitolerans]